MFLQASVILLTEGVLVPGGSPFWGCLVLGGVSASGGGSASRGGSAPVGCLVETPPGTATAAGGMHPTGMHSSFRLHLHHTLNLHHHIYILCVCITMAVPILCVCVMIIFNDDRNPNVTYERTFRNMIQQRDQ